MAYGDLISKAVTIANGASLSDEADLGNLSLVGILTDAAWDSGVMGFVASLTTGGTFLPLYRTDGSEVATGSLAASRWHPVDPADFLGCRFLKIRSGLNGAGVNQAGATVVTLVLRRVG